MRLSFCFAGAASSLVLSSMAFAQNQSSDSPEVVVTATRLEQSLEETMADVTVIDREEIQSRGYKQMSELLFDAVGLQLSSNGGGQQTTSVSIRGQSADTTLVLIDGFRVGQLSGFGGPSIQALPIHAVDRVEILRGNGSALYGADAIGGVIQIITRRAEKDGFEVAVTGGSNQTYGLSVQGALVGEKTSLTASAGYQESAGYPARSSAVAGGNDVDDPYRRNHGLLSLHHDLGQGLTVGMTALNSVSHAEYDSGGAQADGIIFQDLYSTKLEKDWGGGRNSAIRLGQTSERLTFPGAFFFETRSYQTQLHLEHVEPTALGLLLVGAEVLKQDFRSTFAPAVRTVNTDSFLLGLTGEAGAWDYQINVRQDLNDVYEDATTGSLSVAYDFTAIHRVGASLGTGFKRPSFNQISGSLSFSDPGLSLADVTNTDLKPQTSESVELFYQWKQLNQMAKLTLYSVVVADQINNVLVGTSSSRSENVAGDSEARGASFEYAANWHGTNYGVFVEYLDARLATGQRKLRSARRSGKLYAGRQIGLFDVRADLLFAGERREAVFGSSDVDLGGYGVVNLTVGYDINAKSSLTLRVDNVFGKEYELARQYNNPEQDVFLTYRYAF